MHKMNVLIVVGILLALALVSVYAKTNGKNNGFISAVEAKKLLDTDTTAIALDVRTAEEFASGHIPGAKLLPYDEIDAQRAQAVLKTKDTPVVLYCRSGRRSAIAADTLKKLGYTRIYDMGGIGNWNYALER